MKPQLNFLFHIYCISGVLVYVLSVLNTTEHHDSLRYRRKTRLGELVEHIGRSERLTSRLSHFHSWGRRVQSWWRSLVDASRCSYVEQNRFHPMLVFWAATPCGLSGRHQHFRETYCLHLQRLDMGWEGSDRVYGVLLPPCPFQFIFPSYCNVAKVCRYFASRRLRSNK